MRCEHSAYHWRFGFTEAENKIYLGDAYLNW